MLDESILAPLMSRPDLPQIAATLNRALEQERRKREQFRQDLTPSMKAEFIAGEVIMHSPAKAKHLRLTDKSMRLLGTYVEANQLGEAFTEKALVCLTRNDYEPDICFFGDEKAKSFAPNTMEFPAADFVVEVPSDSTESRDRGVKLADYALHGIGEYWIVDCDQETFEQYVLRGAETAYHLARKVSDGEIQSSVITGFRIPVRAAFDQLVNHKTLVGILNTRLT